RNGEKGRTRTHGAAARGPQWESSNLQPRAKIGSASQQKRDSSNANVNGQQWKHCPHGRFQQPKHGNVSKCSRVYDGAARQPAGAEADRDDRQRQPNPAINGDQHQGRRAV
ncbi:unnamed protein product, partial [Ectocarpus sp. 13 AM-2016]